MLVLILLTCRLGFSSFGKGPIKTKQITKTMAEAVAMAMAKKMVRIDKKATNNGGNNKKPEEFNIALTVLFHGDSTFSNTVYEFK